MQWLDPAIALCGIVVIHVLSKLWGHLSYTRKTKRYRGGEIKSYRSHGTIRGDGFVKDLSRALQEHRLLSWYEETYASLGGLNTFTTRVMGRRVIYSCEVENMKAVSTSQWHDFLVEPINGHLDPFVGRVVSTADGEPWHYGRNLLKPYFERHAFANVDRLSPFTNRLFDLIPADRETFDIQPLLSRWFFDVTTAFLFGRSRDSLVHRENQDIILSLTDIMKGASARRSMGRFKFLYRDSKWSNSIKFVHEYLDKHVDEALYELRERTQYPDKFINKPERTDLLWTLVQQVDDRIILRDQLSALWLPSTESTSVLLSNVLFLLSRHDRVWERLQTEVKLLGDEEPTFAKLRAMKYINWVINETQRVIPANTSMTREVARDTTLPRGGGPDGKQPVFCAKGDWVNCNRYMLHRDPVFWGADASEFRPERWDGIRPQWYFVPFGGGPRICPANLMVTTEAAYFLARFCQRYKSLESRDDRPYLPVLHAVVSNLNGVRIAVTE